jgi:hypothetical protein
VVRIAKAITGQRHLDGRPVFLTVHGGQPQHRVDFEMGQNINRQSL